MIEATGLFRKRADAAKHLEAGARKVIVSAPAKEPDVTVALGVNFETAYDPDAHHVISNASCTTNCLAPVAKVLHETIGIRHGADDDRARVHGRPAARWTRRTRTSAAPARRRRTSCRRRPAPRRRSASSIPELEGKLHGFAVRVPVPTGSLVDLTIEARAADDGRGGQRDLRASARTSASSRASSATARSRSSRRDIVRSPYSSIFDAPLTTVVDGTQVKVVAWYDNEWGYSNRLVELAQRVLVPAAVSA